MKTIFLLLTMITLSTSFSQNNYEYGNVIYGVRSNIEKALSVENIEKDISSLNIKERDAVKKLLFNSSKSENLDFELNFSPNFAHYHFIDKMNNDVKSFNLVNIASKANGEYFYDIKNKFTVNIKDHKGQTFFVKNSYDNIEWKLLNETKKIGDFICYKAIGIQNYYFYRSNKNKKFEIVAWYTSNLPIPIGPNGIGGLPGLILELELKSMTYFIKSISLKKNKIKMPSEKKYISISEYNKIKRELYLNRANK